MKKIEVVEHFQDDFSAKTFARPQFKKMLEFLERNKHLVDLILFVRWDRFSRNASESYQMINRLKNLGIEIHAIEQPIDLSIPENKVMLSFL